MAIHRVSRRSYLEIRFSLIIISRWNDKAIHPIFGYASNSFPSPSKRYPSPVWGNKKGALSIGFLPEHSMDLQKG